MVLGSPSELRVIVLPLMTGELSVHFTPPPACGGGRRRDGRAAGLRFPPPVILNPSMPPTR